MNTGRLSELVNSHVLLPSVTIDQGYISHLPLHLDVTIKISDGSGILEVACGLFQKETHEITSLFQLSLFLH